MQEQKRLQITGISALLPPSVSPDGECSHVVNLRCRDDVWRPVGTPSCCYTPADPSHRLIFVHVNESYKHFFTYDDSFLYYEAQETDGEIVPLERPESFELTGVKRMEAVGNALIAFAEELEQLDTTDVPPTAHIAPLTNVFRPDTPAPCTDRALILANARTCSGGYLAVPRVMDEKGDVS